MADTPPTPTDDFPVRDTVLGSVMLVFNHPVPFLKAGWLPVVLYLVANLWAEMTTGGFAPPPQTGDPEETLAYLIGPGGFLETMAYTVLGLVLLLPAITAWIRLTVLGPPEDGRYPLLNLGRAEAVYLVCYILIVIVSGLAALAAILATSIVSSILILILSLAAGGVAGALSGLLGVVGGVLSIGAYLYVTARLLPALGGCAFGEAPDLRGTWTETKPDAPRLAGAFVLLTLAVFLAQILLAFPINLMAGDGPSPFAAGILSLFQALSILIASVFVGRVFAYYRDA